MSKYNNPKPKLDWSWLYDPKLRQDSPKPDWTRFERSLFNAEKSGSQSSGLRDGWKKLAFYQKEHRLIVAALLSFAAARRHDIDNNELLGELLDSLTLFVKSTENKMSREDYSRLEIGLDRIYSFHRRRTKTSRLNLKHAEELINDIHTRKLEASSNPKSRASGDVQKIFNALYPNITQAEVKAEFGRIVAPLIRRRIAESSAGTKKQLPISPKKERQKTKKKHR